MWECNLEGLIKHLDGEMHLTYDKWHNFSISSLENIVIQYATFQKMIETLKRPDAKSAVDLFRSDFLVDMNPKDVTEVQLARFLTAEGVLLAVDGLFRLSSPLVRCLIIRHVIPSVYPSCPSRTIPLPVTG